MEIAKCDKKLDLAKMSLDKVLKVEAQPDYETTIPANVRLANEEKVRFVVSCVIDYPVLTCVVMQRKTLEADVANLVLSKEMFSKLK